jgi:hypothetical protein
MYLTKRERWMGLGLVVFISLWAVYVLGISPAAQRIDTLKRVIPEKQRVLEQLIEKSNQYRVLRAGIDQYKAKADHRDKNFELLGCLETMVKELQMGQNVASMKQDVVDFNGSFSQIIGEVKLESVSLQQLVEFLVKIKSSPYGLKTNSLYARKNTKEPENLDVLIQVSILNPTAGK